VRVCDGLPRPEDLLGPADLIGSPVHREVRVVPDSTGRLSPRTRTVRRQATAIPGSAWSDGHESGLRDRPPSVSGPHSCTLVSCMSGCLSAGPARAGPLVRELARRLSELHRLGSVSPQR
jgi:hypothetical protein